MIELVIEKKTIAGFESVLDTELGETDFIASETQPYRIRISNSDDNVEAFIGGMKLAGFRVGKDIFFTLDEDQKDNIIAQNFFACLFLNQIGFTQIIIETSEKSILVEVEIESTKIHLEDVEAWMTSINEVFPIYKSPSLLSPLSYLKADFERSSSFTSLYSLILEANGLVELISEKCNQPNYLRKGYQKYFEDSGGKELFDYSKPHSWFDESRKWGESNNQNIGAVKIGNVRFEPRNLPRHIGIPTFDNHHNRLLLSGLKGLSFALEMRAKELRENMGELVDLRTQFKSNQSKLLLGRRFQDLIRVTQLNITKTIVFLEAKGITETDKINRIEPDKRFLDLTRDIHKLISISQEFRKTTKLGKEKIGLLGLDLLFELFCFSNIIKIFRRLGFSITDADDIGALNQYIELFSEQAKIGVRIFYDVGVPKETQTLDGYPLYDYLVTGNPKRPDFLMHIFDDQHEAVVILDAKYKTKEKLQKEFKKFNADHLLVKYGTKFFSANNISVPPIYVGAICLKSDSDFNSINKKLVMSYGNNQLPFQGFGLTELGSEDDMALANLLNENLMKFKNLKSLLQPMQLSSRVKPVFKDFLQQPFPKIRENKFEQSITQITNTINKKIERVTSSKAPTLEAADASIIKGMLLRGDKPQDIAFWFGVNNGRISEIKNGTNFVDVPPEKFEKLPPAGPYPPLKDLLGSSDLK